jgi:hypothetical protein
VETVVASLASSHNLIPEIVLGENSKLVIKLILLVYLSGDHPGQFTACTVN